jgi:hydroxypyruvate isomerase
MFSSDDHTHEEVFEAARAAGYEAVEFWNRDQYGDHRRIFDLAIASGLKISSMIGHSSLTDGMNRTENHGRIHAEIVDSLEVAVRFEIPGVICFSGNRFSTQSDLDGMRVCAQVLRSVAPLAEVAGVTLNVELLNSRVDHPDYLCDRSDWAFALCDMVASPRVRVLYDIYHMQIMEGDIIRTITANIGMIGHIHTAGVPGRGPLNAEQELNYSAICAAVAGAGYAGYVGHEFKPSGDPIEGLREAFDTCAPSSEK